MFTVYIYILAGVYYQLVVSKLAAKGFSVKDRGKLRIPTFVGIV